MIMEQPCPDLRAQEPVQAEIAGNYGVSQPTINRAISAISPLLVQALLCYIPTAYLEWLRWPGGFTCPSCGHVEG
jgi:hypothetical protein